MVDGVILAIVAVIMLIALRGAIKHFKGDGPCCGGGESSLLGSDEKRLANPIIGKKTVKISGMHCDHCVRSVTEAINKIDGASARVTLRSETAVVSYDREVSDDAIKKAVKEAGFTVVSITA